MVTVHVVIAGIDYTFNAIIGVLHFFNSHSLHTSAVNINESIFIICRSELFHAGKTKKSLFQASFAGLFLNIFYNIHQSLLNACINFNLSLLESCLI
jgi:hypothetical protein